MGIFDYKALYGYDIIEDASLVDTVVDWSMCRSRARAERRLKRGYPQRIRHIQVPKQSIYIMDNHIIMHPELAKVVREQVSK